MNPKEVIMILKRDGKEFTATCDLEKSRYPEGELEEKMDVMFKFFRAWLRKKIKEYPIDEIPANLAEIEKQLNEIEITGIGFFDEFENS